MPRRFLLLCITAALGLSAQTYSGPRPQIPDVPYLKHAAGLISTEVGVAKDEKKKDTITHIVEGASSPVVTPLAAPIFLFQAEKIAPESLQLYRLESKNGHREVTETQKKPIKPLRVDYNRLTSDKLWQIEVDESLLPGEYAFSPDGSDKVFCFQVR